MATTRKSDSSPHILILGAGITGLSAALALSHSHNQPKTLSNPSPPQITILEIRPTPSTLGGAVNLTTTALRHLDHLEVYSVIKQSNYGAECHVIDLFDLHTSQRIAGVDFTGFDGSGVPASTGGKAYISRRIMRSDLQSALVEAVSRLPNVSIQWGCKTVRIDETDSNVTLYYEHLNAQQHSSIAGTILLGCDGIHSALRTLHVEPSRSPTYTGIAVAMAFTSLPPLPGSPPDRGTSLLPWRDTGLASSRRGSFMASYFESTRQEQYVCAVMQTEEVQHREGWTATGKEQEQMRREILHRFDVPGDLGQVCAQLVKSAREWRLYPVFALPPHGEWASVGGRCLLLGDAAHAMPPQGESTGLCIEDTIIFARHMMHYHHRRPDNNPPPPPSASAPPSLQTIFNTYTACRRSRINACFDEAKWRWETVRDSGWLMHKVKMWAMPWFLWWSEEKRQKDFGEDFWDMEVEF